MKFHSIEIDAFGALAGTQLDELHGGLNVVYGPNGSGKTTLLHFLRGVFCGFAPARRLNLLPSGGKAPAGGAVSAHSGSGLCRFQRTGDAGADHMLRVTRVQGGRHRRFVLNAPSRCKTALPQSTTHEQTPSGGRQTTHPDFDPDGLPSEQIPLLYSVERTNVHSFDGLIRMALQDGIDLSPRALAAAEVDAERDEQSDAARRRIDELGEQKRRLQAEVRQLRSQYEERSRRANAERLARAAHQRSAWRQRIDWLQTELQAVESDLREAEERAWRSDGERSSVSTAPSAPRLRLGRIPSTSHVAVDHLSEVDEIDRRIGSARQRLAEIAKARLEINLRAARIAGSPEVATDEFLKQLRVSLSLMEDSLLELRDVSATSDRGERPATPEFVIDEIRQRLYGTCEHVSTFEIQHVKSRLDAEADRLDQEEQAQLDELETLQHQRQQLLERTGQLTLRRGASGRTIEQEFCRCSEHGRQDEQRPIRERPAPQIDERETAAERSHARPTPEDLSRLRKQKNRLSQDLDEARNSWRRFRQDAGQLELPQDVARLRHDVDRKQLEVDRIEQELTVAQEDWLRLSIERDRHAAQQTPKDDRPRCLRWAAEYLARLTGGRYVDVRIVSEHHELLVVDEQGAEWTTWSLSRGTLDQAALSLRLALVREYAARDVRFPLILDDVLVECDVDRLQEAVRLLNEFADEHGQQIVYLTCGTHLVGLFVEAGAALHTMPGSTVRLPEQNPLTEPPARWSVQGWIDRRFRARHDGSDATSERGKSEVGRQTRRSSDTPTSDQRGPAAPSSLPFHRRQPGGPYWLSLDSPLVLVPSIGEQMGRRLIALGIHTVGDLLELAADESAIPLKSLQVDVGRLREWQAEALLLSCIPDLAGPDAQLLVACGVRDPHQLAECDVAELINRLDRFARRNRDAHIRAEQPTRDDLQRWIQSARRSRSLPEAQRQSRRGQDRRDASDAKRAVPVPFSVSSPSESAEEAVTRNFYLSSQSPVVDAPSIGPRMASRLEKLGIISVGDLLAHNPDDVAERLKHRRVKPETVAAWQQQARLMCCIPQLRGHDAQVLVACEITEPEQVARLDARTLFSIVGPFVATKEGQRLLRSSKTPDLEEVAEWIDWANHARPLKAA